MFSLTRFPKSHQDDSRSSDQSSQEVCFLLLPLEQEVKGQKDLLGTIHQGLKFEFDLQELPRNSLEYPQIGSTTW